MNPLARPRVLQLDVLRGIAILLVIGNHFPLPREEAGFLAPLSELLYRFGWTGVDLFFILSGYLIGSLLFKELSERGGLDVPRFLLRRGLKIWPAYYVYVGAVLLMVLRDHPGDGWQVARQVAPTLVYLQNYLWPWSEHLWSLAVEEHFYLVLPLLLLGLTKRSHGVVEYRSNAVPESGSDTPPLHDSNTPLRLIPRLALILLAVCLGLRLLNLGRPYADLTHFYPTHLRLDSLFSGVLLAYLAAYRPEVLGRAGRRPLLLLGVGLLLVAPMTLLNPRAPFVWTFGFTLLAVGYGCILVAALQWRRRPGGTWERLAGGAARAIARIGVLSYSIYLWHDLGRIPLKGWLQPGSLPGLSPEFRWLVVNLLYAACAVLFGALMARIVELPVLALRDRVLPSRTGPGLPGVPPAEGIEPAEGEPYPIPDPEPTPR